jgi:hypothetical protein
LRYYHLIFEDWQASIDRQGESMQPQGSGLKRWD